MAKIALVTDSSCDLTHETIQSLNIEVVPLRIIYNEREYRDGVEISAIEVYDRLEEEVPTTSMPSPEDIFHTYQKLQDEGYTHCIVLSVSAALSGTYNAFKLVAQEFRMNIEVIDSKGVSWILGFLVMEAARLIQEKVDYIEIIEKIEKAKEKIKGFFIVDTLEYLKRGGRIGKVAATLGSAISLKPIISFDEEGKVFPYSIARGKKQAIKKLLEPVLKQLEYTKTSIAVLHSKAEQEAEALLERFRELENVCELYLNHISPALVVHGGPGLLGIVVKPHE